MSSSTFPLEVEDRVKDKCIENIPLENEETVQTSTYVQSAEARSENSQRYIFQKSFRKWSLRFGEGIINDIIRRRKFYYSDWSDGLHKKLASVIFFLYFACLLPSIAFGALNESTTNGFFSVRKTIISQAIGGIIFSLFSTQPLVILLSTAPLAIFIKLAYDISIAENIPFDSFYAWIGIFNSVFLILFGITNVSDIFTKFSSLFLCETFGLFISFALSFDAIKALVLQFILNYKENTRDNPLLWLILMYATVAVGLYFKNIRNIKIFHSSTSEVIEDFALPLSILLTSIFGSFVFQDIHLLGYNTANNIDIHVPILYIDIKGILIAIPLGFALSLLMFIDQSISVALISTSKNKLQKGIYYHFDIILLAIITAILSILGLPWIHGALPHTQMHATALAETENTSEREREIIKSIESRLGVFLSHILIGCSYFLLPLPLKYIPYPVLYGLFLYLAITALPENSFYLRMLQIMRDPKPLFQEIKREEENSKIMEDRNLNESITGSTRRKNKKSNRIDKSDSKEDVYTDNNDEEENKINMTEESEMKNGREEVVCCGKCVDEEVRLDIKNSEIIFIPLSPPIKIIYQFTIIQFFFFLLLCLCGLFPFPYLNVCFPFLLFFVLPFRSIILKNIFQNDLDLLDKRTIE